MKERVVCIDVPLPIPKSQKLSKLHFLKCQPQIDNTEKFARQNAQISPD